MKKILAAVLITMIATIASPAFAADYWKMTGVMAVYPGTFNYPFSAPIVNDTKYASKTDCDDAINEITQSHPKFSAINDGKVLPAQDASQGWIAVGATCLKHSE